MFPNKVNTQSDDWALSLLTGNESSVRNLAVVVFGLSSSKARLEAMSEGDGCEAQLQAKKDTCHYLLTSSILANGITTLEYLEVTPLALVHGIYKVPFIGRYLPPPMVGPLVSAKE